jgi:hypothetical protein
MHSAHAQCTARRHRAHTHRVVGQEVVHVEADLGAVHAGAVVPHAEVPQHLPVVVQKLALDVPHAPDLHRAGVSQGGLHEPLQRVGLLAVVPGLVRAGFPCLDRLPQRRVAVLGCRLVLGQRSAVLAAPRLHTCVRECVYVGVDRGGGEGRARSAESNTPWPVHTSRRQPSPVRVHTFACAPRTHPTPPHPRHARAPRTRVKSSTPVTRNSRPYTPTSSPMWRSVQCRKPPPVLGIACRLMNGPWSMPLFST